MLFLIGPHLLLYSKLECSRSEIQELPTHVRWKSHQHLEGQHQEEVPSADQQYLTFFQLKLQKRW